MVEIKRNSKGPTLKNYFCSNTVKTCRVIWATINSRKIRLPQNISRPACLCVLHNVLKGFTQPAKLHLASVVAMRKLTISYMPIKRL